MCYCDKQQQRSGYQQQNVFLIEISFVNIFNAVIETVMPIETYSFLDHNMNFDHLLEENSKHEQRQN
jgi:hypothetical protein